MIAAILQILAAIIPIIMEALDERKQVHQADETFDRALADGDADAIGSLLSARYDRVRHKR